ncbi:MAG: hypothetical protein A2W80_14185 [Candidatus Riflebacteria bacterium GWC2_50_8]|nr:MAG: hypothetical protein A2W80_14185 [Candidatus Riflebacteria bacterium GWC2_50_8]
MKRAFKILLVTALVISLVIAAELHFGPMQLHNPAYLWWIMSGEPCSAEYLQKYVLNDYRSSRIIEGQREEEIRRRFPMLHDAESFAEGGYRRNVLDYKRNNPFKGQKLKMFWFDDQDSGGWAILLVDGVGLKIELVKG